MIQRIALAALLLALPCVAQTPAELLQKAIYAQETAGDTAGAIQIYRQITANAPLQSPVAAQAQYRIADLMLQKGDLSAAAMEFSILATRYSENQALIAKMVTRIREFRASMPTAGVVKDGRYRNTRTGLEVPLPAPWKTTYDGESSDGGEMLGVTDGKVEFGIWMRPEASTAEQIPEKLRASVPAKVKMNEGVPGFKFRPETIQNRTIAGCQALTAVADLGDGNKRVTIYTWIYTPKTHVVVIAGGVPADDLVTVQARMDQFVSTVVVP